MSTGGLPGPVPLAAIRVGGRYLAELARIVLVPAIDLWMLAPDLAIIGDGFGPGAAVNP